MEESPFSKTWNLDSLYPGGSSSPSLLAALDRLNHEINYFSCKFKQLSDIKTGLLHFQELEGHCKDLQHFISCLLAQNVEDQEALKLNDLITDIAANQETLSEKIDHLLAKLDDASMESLLGDDDIQPISFHIKERCRRIKQKLSIEQESLVHQLSKDGYQGWSDIYQTLIGDLRILSPFPSEGSFSVGQAENRLSHPDRAVRKAWFLRMQETWKAQENMAAQMLNRLAGFRLSLYKARKSPSILHEPLFCNRMQEKTLQTMWQTVEKHKNCQQLYMRRKAELLGIEKLAWYDIDAPLPGGQDTSIPFDAAAEFIIRHFTAFSPAMGDFAKLAFDQHWIEAEDRAGKRPGGFCAPLMHPKQSRIFMTYSGTMQNVFTLAHELGHAYHSFEMRNLPLFAQSYPMNVAETASTLAEMIIIDSMIEESGSAKMKRALLDHKLQRASIFLMNIHARFLFEIAFYEERRKGFVLAKNLNHLMAESQKKAFCDSLAEWHPHFWISKQHFYFTDVPFYNFPYTFGFLFSQGIYFHLKQKKDRGNAYAALLRDTGKMTVEELGMKHLGAALDQPDFWENALMLIEKDAADYSLLTL